MSQPRGRHTLSTRIIQTSLRMAINDFFLKREFTLTSQSIPQSVPAHPELEKNQYNTTSRIRDIMKHHRTQGLLPSYTAIKTPARSRADTTYVTTLATITTRSEVLLPTDLVTAMPCLSHDFRAGSLEMHLDFLHPTDAYIKAFKMP